MAFKYFAFGVLALAFAGSSALAQPLGRPPLPPGVIPPPDYEPSPEELAAAEELDRTNCGICRFYSPANDVCIDVPAKFSCDGNLGHEGKACGPCGYLESEEGDGIGHCIDLDPETCNAPLPKAAALAPGKAPLPVPAAAGTNANAAAAAAAATESAEDEDSGEEAAEDEDTYETDDEIVHMPPPPHHPPHGRH